MSKENIAGVTRGLIESCLQFSTSTLSDAMGHAHAMHSAIRQIVPKSRICGQAFTVRCYPGDNLMCHYAVSQAGEGDVLVVDGSGNSEVALWGSLLSLSSVHRKLGGTIIDGAVRDVEELQRIGYPVYARAITPRSCFKAHAGEINVPISCGGVSVCQGDMVLADLDGIIVIPRACVQNIVDKAKRIAAKESGIAANIERGATTYEALGLSELMGERRR
jgi:4-hydroxy-4-methyl-2-oxoglutarate aldolase